MKTVRWFLLISLLATAMSAFSAEPRPTPEPQGFPQISEIFREAVPDPDSTWDVRLIEITLRLFIAVILSSLLAFRPRRNIPFFQRNLYVAQTQILLAVVAAALMMIVGDSAARAFGIFAAVSLVRFRTNIRDPKEITVLLISLALGLAAGIGRWELGSALCLFAVGLLWLLERHESEQVYRPMELKIKTRNLEKTRVVLKEIFQTYRLEAEVREIERRKESESTGSIVYLLNLPLNVSTDDLSKEILAVPDQIESIEWEQPKHTANIYQ